MSMYPMCADLVNEGGGEPQAVGVLGEHEQRPSPPISRAACIDAMSFAARSPGVVSAANTACSTHRRPREHIALDRINNRAVLAGLAAGPRARAGAAEGRGASERVDHAVLARLMTAIERRELSEDVRGRDALSQSVADEDAVLTGIVTNGLRRRRANTGDEHGCPGTEIETARHVADRPRSHPSACRSG
jgi:hypothetical protein